MREADRGQFMTGETRREPFINDVGIRMALREETVYLTNPSMQTAEYNWKIASL